MNRIVYFAILMGLATTGDAQVMGGLAEVAIIDRDSGTVLSPHFYHGEYWVAGRPGARYAIEIRNRLGERLLAVTSVDGVNVVSGATAGWDQTGYVFGPGELSQILRGTHRTPGERRGHRRGDISRACTTAGLFDADDRAVFGSGGGAARI